MMRETSKAAALSLLLASAPAFTLQSDSRQPIQIEADQGSLDQAKQVTHFSGNVIIRQGTLSLCAVNVRVSRNDKDEQLMVTDDSPVRSDQTLDDNQSVVNGQANNAEYSSATDIVKLTSNAKAQHSGDVARGAVITYSMRTEAHNIISGGKSSAKAGTESGRVSVVIQPSNMQKK